MARVWSAVSDPTEPARNRVLDQLSGVNLNRERGNTDGFLYLPRFPHGAQNTCADGFGWIRQRNTWLCSVAGSGGRAQHAALELPRGGPTGGMLLLAARADRGRGARHARYCQHFKMCARASLIIMGLMDVILDVDLF